MARRGLPGFDRWVAARRAQVGSWSPAGSARAQAGDIPAPTVDGAILVLGLVLVASVATSFYAAHRVSSLLTRRAEASGRVVRLSAVTKKDALSDSNGPSTRSSTSSATRGGAKRIYRRPGGGEACQNGRIMGL